MMISSPRIDETMALHYQLPEIISTILRHDSPEPRVRFEPFRRGDHPSRARTGD